MSVYSLEECNFEPTIYEKKISLGWQLVPSPDGGREILQKIRELFHHNSSLCAECVIRNYVSRVQNIHSQMIECVN